MTEDNDNSFKYAWIVLALVIGIPLFFIGVGATIKIYQILFFSSAKGQVSIINLIVIIGAGLLIYNKWIKEY